MISRHKLGLVVGSFLGTMAPGVVNAGGFGLCATTHRFRFSHSLHSAAVHIDAIQAQRGPCFGSNHVRSGVLVRLDIGDDLELA